MKNKFVILLPMVIVIGFARAVPAKPPALQLVAEKFARDVGSHIQAMTHDVPLIVISLQADQALMGHEGRLLQELEQLLIFQFEAGSAVERVLVLEKGEVDDAIENSRRQGATMLLRCVLGVKGKKLLLTGDLYPLKKNFWERLVEPTPVGSSRHFFITVSMDQEIFLLMDSSKAPPSLGSWRLTQLLYLPKRILDIGEGDLDGDGTQELVLLLDDSLEIYAIAHGDLAPRHIAEYNLNLIPEAKVLSRDPVGTLLVADFNHDGKAEIFFNYFNRRYGQILSWTGAKLVALRRLEKNPLCLLRLGSRPVLVYGKGVVGKNYFAREIELADINSSRGKVHELPTPFSTLRCWQNDSGTSKIVVIDNSGNLTQFSIGWVTEVTRPNCGVGSALADMDGDGVAELIVSDSVLPGEADSVKVISKGEVAFNSKDVLGGVMAITPVEYPETGALIVTLNRADNTSRVYMLGR